jgi:AcrR family transcriptional regulator
MPPDREPLTRERVLEVALALADEEGIDALSMRRLGQELGVKGMSLYNHVAGKDEILDGILEMVASEIEIPPDRPEWRAAVRRSTISARDAHVRHPWASPLAAARQSGGPVQMRRMDWLLRTLRNAGLGPTLVYHGLHVLDAYVLGFTALHTSFPYQGEELARRVQAFLADATMTGHPDLLDHIQAHTRSDHGDVDGFELGLDLLLDGLERLRDERAAPQA